VRSALDAESYEQACERSQAASGKSLSKQAFAILPKIREVDEILRGLNGPSRERIREVHPELCFRVWNGAPLLDPKKSGVGFATRLRLVETRFPSQFDLVRRGVSRREAADDDILDAFAALWTAERILHGRALIFPETPAPRDSVGLPMEMLA